MRASRAVAAIVAGVLVACAPAGARAPATDAARTAPTGARTSAPRDALRDEIVLVGWHADVAWLAAGPRLVWGATDDGLIVYDRTLGAFRPPVTALDGLPRPPYDALVVDATDAAWVRARGQWWRALSPGGVAPAPAPLGEVYRPMGLGELAQRWPRVSAMAGQLFRDGTDRPWPPRAPAGTPAGSELWVGTSGGGLFQVDPLFARATSRPFGLLSRGVGALAALGDELCVQGDGRAPWRPGVACASADLARWRWLDPYAREVAELAPRWSGFDHAPAIDASLASVARAEGLAPLVGVAADARAHWVAGRGGLLTITHPGEGRRRWRLGAALPGEPTAMLLTPTVAWIGTTAGLLRVRRASDGGLP